MKIYNNCLADFREGYYMYIPLSIIFQSCLGSVSILYLTQLNFTLSTFIMVTLCTIVCMAYNAAVLAQLNVKWVFNLLLISIITNILILGILTF